MLQIKLRGKEKIYRQISNQIIYFIDAHVLKPDEPLPSCRSLAKELHINPNTVMHAYQDLEDKGYLYSVANKGFYINVKDSAYDTVSDSDVYHLLKELKRKGFEKEELILLVNEVYTGN